MASIWPPYGSFDPCVFPFASRRSIQCCSTQMLSLFPLVVVITLMQVLTGGMVLWMVWAWEQRSRRQFLVSVTA